MLKTPRGPTSKATTTLSSLVVFVVGGKRLAARADEIGGVRAWSPALPIPSRTPFINSVVRYEDEVLPVYDLAARLGVRIAEGDSLCLVAKRRDGAMAVCIDAEIPTLHAVDLAGIRPASRQDPDMAGICMIGGEEVPVYSLAALGLGATPTAPR
nr:chemotaxis protein CheW [Nitrospirota bacterium]